MKYVRFLSSSNDYMGAVTKQLIKAQVLTPAGYSGTFRSWNAAFKRLFVWWLIRNSLILLCKKYRGCTFKQYIKSFSMERLQWQAMNVIFTQKVFHKTSNSLNLPDFSSAPLASTLQAVLTRFMAPHSCAFWKLLSNSGLPSKNPVSASIKEGFEDSAKCRSPGSRQKKLRILLAETRSS